MVANTVNELPTRGTKCLALSIHAAKTPNYYLVIAITKLHIKYLKAY